MGCRTNKIIFALIKCLFFGAVDQNKGKTSMNFLFIFEGVDKPACPKEGFIFAHMVTLFNNLIFFLGLTEFLLRNVIFTVLGSKKKGNIFTNNVFFFISK